MIKPLDVEILLGGHVYTWNGKATFNVYENDHRFREKFNCDCFTMPVSYTHLTLPTNREV